MATDLGSLRWAQVPGVDFSPLGNLLQTYRDARMQGNQDRILSQIDPTNPQSMNQIGAMLLKSGNVPGGTAVTQLARQNSQDEWQRTYQGGMLDVARQQANRQETPVDVQKLRAAGIAPGTPEAQRALFPSAADKLTPSDKRAINTAEDEIAPLKGTVESLKRALELNPKTFAGYGAEFFGKLGTGVAGALGNPNLASEQARATTEWSKIMSLDSIKNMAETLKGSTTNFELQRFVDILGDPTTPIDTRERIIKRMLTLAENQKQLNEARMRDMRGGTYYKPGYDPTASQNVAPQGDAGQQGSWTDPVTKKTYKVINGQLVE